MIQSLGTHSLAPETGTVVPPITSGASVEGRGQTAEGLGPAPPGAAGWVMGPHYDVEDRHQARYWRNKVLSDWVLGTPQREGLHLMAGENWAVIQRLHSSTQ